MRPEGRRMLAQIEASITAMNGLFNALLDVSRLDAGVVTVERRPFAIQSLMDRVSRDFVREAETKGVSLVWKACAAVVDSDPVLAERILRNLVSNAVGSASLSVLFGLIGWLADKPGHAEKYRLGSRAGRAGSWGRAGR
jgi:signal transduction histidine kinase